MLKRGDRCEYLHYTLPCASSLITLSDGAESPDTRPRISALDLGTIAQPGTAKLNMAEDMITDDVQVSSFGVCLGQLFTGRCVKGNQTDGDMNISASCILCLDLTDGNE